MKWKFSVCASRCLFLSLMVPLAFMLSGCAVPQTYKSTTFRTFALEPGDLEHYGIAIVTPSTVTGQEEEKQAVAVTFTDVLYKERPGIPIRSLPQTLSAVNKAGLDEEYKQMFVDYRETGVFKRQGLKELSQATGVRYMGQLKLSGFQQGSDSRLGVFGLRVISTKQASIRLFFQIWDSSDGSIVWEGVNELQRSMDTAMEEQVTLKTVLERASLELINRLPERLDKTRALP